MVGVAGERRVGQSKSVVQGVWVTGHEDVGPEMGASELGVETLKAAV